MNVELLLKIKGQILKEPKQFQMGQWFAKSLDDKTNDIPNCGTAACIGGWAMTIDRGMNPKETDECFEVDFATKARNLLGLRYSQGLNLFILNNWPENFRNTYLEAVKASNLIEAARIAAKRIDHFIDTNGK